MFFSIITEDKCNIVLRREKDTILQFKQKDVMIVKLVGSNHTQVIFITRSENFGRAAVVLQMLNEIEATKLVDKLSEVEIKSDSK